MENLGNPVKLELTLRRLSMTALITRIYEHPDIKKKTKRIILTNRVDEDNFPFKPLRNAINRLALQKLEKLKLPPKLLSEAQGMTIIFAKKIVCLADYVTRVFGLTLPYIDVIYWKSIGTIDELKMFTTYWKKHGTFTKIIRKDSVNHLVMSGLGCTYANEEVVLKFQNPMIKDLQRFLGRVKLPNIKNNFLQIMASYLCYLHGEVYDMTRCEDVHHNFTKTGKITMKDAILVCARQGLVEAVKYFWNLLSDAEKEEMVSQLAFIGICGELHFAEIISEEDKYEEIFRVRGVELLYFLINSMSPEKREEFLKQYCGGVIQVFLMVWPYQEICLKILDEDWITEITEDESKLILHQVLFRLVNDDLHESSVYQNVLYEILRKAIKLVSEEGKDEMLFHYGLPRHDDVEAIECFYERFDLTALSIIINDEDLEDHKEFMISMGSDKFKKLKKENNLELLIRFVEEVLVTNEERKDFVKEYGLSRMFSKAKNPNIREKVKSLSLV